MKINFTIPKRLERSLSGGAALAGILLLSGVAANAQPFASPVGTWDVIESGPRSGVAKMTFNSDFTITMEQVIVPNVPKSPSSTASTSRNGGFNSSRDGLIITGGTTNGLPPHTNLFGFFSFPLNDFPDGGGNTVHAGVSAGQWGFDTAGHLFGFWMEISAPSAISTNATDVNLTRLTNAISFNGRVVLAANPTNSRVTLVCSTPAGKVTFSGLTFIAMPDISGSWYGTEVAQGLPYNELFTVTTFDVNDYDVQGSGPQYEDFGLGFNFLGETLVSRRNKIGFVTSHPVANSDKIEVRAVIGPINYRKLTFTGRGWDSSAYAGSSPVSFKASHSPAAPD